MKKQSFSALVRVITPGEAYAKANGEDAALLQLDKYDKETILLECLFGEMPVRSSWRVTEDGKEVQRQGMVHAVTGSIAEGSLEVGHTYWVSFKNGGQTPYTIKHGPHAGKEAVGTQWNITVIAQVSREDGTVPPIDLFTYEDRMGEGIVVEDPVQIKGVNSGKRSYTGSGEKEEAKKEVPAEEQAGG